MENEDIEILELSAKVYNALSRFFRSKNIEQTIGELIKISFDDLSKIRNLGDVGFKEVLDKVHLIEPPLKFEFESLLGNDDNYESMSRVNVLELNKVKLLQIKEQQKIDKLSETQVANRENINSDIVNSRKYEGSLSIEVLCLSNRSINALTKFGRIESIEELLNKTTREIRGIRNLGPESYNDILKSLHILGLKLNDEEIAEEEIEITEEYFSNIDSLNEEYGESEALSQKRSELELKGRIINKMISISKISNKKTY